MLTGTQLFIVALAVLLLIVAMAANAVVARHKSAVDRDSAEVADNLSKLVDYAHDTFQLLEHLDATLNEMRDTLDRIDERAADETAARLVK